MKNFKAKRLDNGEFVTGWFTKKKIGQLIVPVIERYRECDTGDYIESVEIDGETILEVCDDEPVCSMCDAKATVLFCQSCFNDSYVI